MAVGETLYTGRLDITGRKTGRQRGRSRLYYVTSFAAVSLQRKNSLQVRQGLKEYSKWPTYPQFYVDGELIGGLDILKEMDDSGELREALPKTKAKGAEDINKRLERLIKQADVMVFMKGTPGEPRCGFSRQLMEILRPMEIPFQTFDILTDEEVRQGLKVYSKWPTYPQVVRC